MDEFSARAVASKMEAYAARKNTRAVRGKSVVYRAWETACLISFKGGANGAYTGSFLGEAAWEGAWRATIKVLPATLHRLRPYVLRANGGMVAPRRLPRKRSLYFHYIIWNNLSG
jgi:hypothetical protein